MVWDQIVPFAESARERRVTTSELTRSIQKRLDTLPNWLRQLTAVSFLFFLAKGMLWLGVAAWIIL
ncbi:MAG: hypothetical protein B6D77_11435 [gamma proteobacterium symbiont of Ctena orbiculata]|nr:MAG: hypothetical protein B6D77_11435 [gamma proteobacterium symbiont of Ctena orbiculata]PVV17075.1 MAG: hypothetical protein B6D79_17260 [gamma proteobacterium symbiont of Ctena orbiculata]PVV20036.1 MAG: hypothetical protein B6D78_11980 [gamma proteobacterium symbiont of Ctena orbiculata]